MGYRRDAGLWSERKRSEAASNALAALASLQKMKNEREMCSFGKMKKRRRICSDAARVGLVCRVSAGLWNTIVKEAKRRAVVPGAKNKSQRAYTHEAVSRTHRLFFR